MLNKALMFAMVFMSCIGCHAGEMNLTNEVMRLFLQPPDDVPGGYSENDEMRVQKECTTRFAKEYGLTETEIVRLMCAALEKLLDKPEKTSADQHLIGQGLGALKDMGDRFATNVLEKSVFIPDIKSRSYAILCYFALAREDGIDAAYRMLAKPDVFQRGDRFEIYYQGIRPLVEADKKESLPKIAAFLHHALKVEDIEDNVTYIDRYLLKADPTWEKNEARKRLADSFVKKSAVLPYFREVQQKIGKPTTEAEGK